VERPAERAQSRAIDMTRNVIGSGVQEGL